MAFRLALDDDAAPQQLEASPSSRAIIVHPLSLFNGSAASPTYSPVEWLRATYDFQKGELRQLRTHQQQQQQADAATSDSKRPRALLDYTCDENVRSILGFLDGVSLCRARRVNRYFHQLGGNEQLWYRLCKTEWHISPEQLRTPPESYQALYKYACRSLKLLIREVVEEQCLSSLQASFRIPREAALMITRGPPAV